MIPWRYVFDLIDLGLVGVFGVMGLVEAIRVFRGEHESSAHWPTLAYVRRLFVLYAIVWLVAEATALVAICVRFAPLNVAIDMSIVATMVLTISTALRLTRTPIR